MAVPCSPTIELDGIPYFPRLCEKVRLHAAGELREDLHGNLGLGMDLWTCQFLGVAYEDLKAKILELGPDEPLRNEIRKVDDVVYAEVDNPWVLHDLDHPEDVDKARDYLASRGESTSP